MVLAAIDIGTNTVLLTIEKLLDKACITRLGEGLHREPRFLAAAEDRTLEVLRDYKRLCDEAGVQVIKAVGTAAFRKAANASDFVARVQRETGITIEIISGQREAELSYLSAQHDFPDLDNLVVLDIGGGSTEIIGQWWSSGGVDPTSSKAVAGWPHRGGNSPHETSVSVSPACRGDKTLSKCQDPAWRLSSVSLDLGCVVLTESLLRHDPISEREYRALEATIDRKIDAAFFDASLQPLIDAHPSLVGLAGSVTTLSAIQQGLVAWDGARVQGSVLTDENLEDLVELFRRTSVAEKKKIPGMVAGREDTILAGTLILRKVMDVLGCEQVIVSDRGLRFGLLYEAAGTASI